MSKFDPELRRRLLSGEDIPAIRRWFMRVIAANNLGHSDLSALERHFWEDLKKDYEAWKAARVIH